MCLPVCCACQGVFNSCAKQTLHANKSWCQALYIMSFSPYSSSLSHNTLYNKCSFVLGILHHLSSHWGVKCFNRLCVPVSLTLPVSLFLCPEARAAEFAVWSIPDAQQVPWFSQQMSFKHEDEGKGWGRSWSHSSLLLTLQLSHAIVW